MSLAARKIYHLPEWLEGVDAVQLRAELINIAAMDEFVPANREEALRCWFCYRSSFIRWGKVICCYGTGACHTHYALGPVTAEDLLVTERSRCPGCGEAGQKLNCFSFRCLRCRKITDLENNWKVDSMIALIELSKRAAFRVEGTLLPIGGPSWSKAAVRPWQPRKDINDRRKMRERQRLYNKVDLQRVEKGLDPMVDNRRLRRDSWKSEPKGE